MSTASPPPGSSDRPATPGVDTADATAVPGGEHLQRGLKARHINMIAIGGAIGTGLFVASGKTISNAGPGGALVSYAAIGFMVFLLMQSLGEMATYLPIASSFEAYGTRFVSPSFGFAVGWNYWFNWAITVAVELVAAALVMQFWWPDTPGWIWSLLFLVILFLLNAINVKAFGEGEFIFASIKVITVIVFLAVGVAMIFGILGGKSPGFSNWTTGDAPFVGGFAGMMSVFMVAGFSFQGTEMVGVTAGEAEHPEKTIPKAIRSVFVRILLFYIGAIAVIGFLIPYTDSRLLGASENDDITIAPFTLVFQNAGVLGAATVMNAVILTAILSAGNSGMYASTRMLYGLALSGKAPRMFTKVTKNGIPLPALLATTAIGALCFLTSLIGDQSAYTWLVNASGLAGFITWMGIAWCHFNFRRAYVAQGHDPKDLPYRAALFPIGPIVALIMCVVVVIGQGTDFFLDPVNELPGILATYIGLPLFLAMWIGHKIVTREPAVDLRHADLGRE